MLKIVVTMSINPDELHRLENLAKVFVGGWGKTGVRLTEKELTEALQDAEIALVGYENLNREIIEKSKKLKLIGCPRSNPVNVDIQAASDHNIPVLYTPGRNAIATAEYTLGLMLAESRNIARSYHAMKSGKFLGNPTTDLLKVDTSPDVIWDLDGESPYKIFRGSELSDHILGLIGLGSIGSRVARLAQAFGMRVVAYSLSKDADKAKALGVELISLDKVMKISDFISIHCRVTPETIGLLGKKEIDLMKPSAYLINTARAVIVDQQALLEALQTQRIAGAALDVYWNEPIPSNHPLLQLENATFTPHLAGSTIEVTERHSKMIVDDVLAWMDGRIPQHVLNPKVLS
ncbi:MAG: 2-hydroxyacid dehydrogenase [Anaerolineaceae bacterium]